jgi:hypothetical protein
MMNFIFRIILEKLLVAALRIERELNGVLCENCPFKRSTERVENSTEIYNAIS